MKYKFIAKLFLVSCLNFYSFGCGTQTISNSAVNVNSNAAANSANVSNQTNAEAKMSAPQTVEFESADKVEIVGTFYESPKVNSPAVLLLHQWMQNRTSYDDFARRLQAQGLGVLAIDGRGFGESKKTTDGKNFALDPNSESLDAKTVKAMKSDVDTAFQFLAKQKNVDASRIGIVGASYGSSLAIIYAAENPKVKAVALLSPGINYFNNLPTEPAVKTYGARPLLLVAAEDDQESADSVKKLKATDEKAEVKIYDKGGHGTELFKVGLEDLLENFLTKNL